MQLPEYKKLFFRGKHVHLNNAGLSPISKPVKDEIDYWTTRFYEDGFHSDADYKNRIEWSRSQIAQLIDCATDEIAFFQSCAWAISQFAFGIDLQKDDEVLIFEQEYSSHLYPWQSACKKAGSKLIILESGACLEVPLEIILEKITARTKVIAISWVEYQTGAIFNLKALSLVCQQKNILLFVDATQALGIHQLSFKQLAIDGLACSSHKWLNGPVGVGFLAIKKKLASTMSPIGVGALTYGDCGDPSLLECIPKLNALKFEAGAKQALEINALGKAVEIINLVGCNPLQAEAFRYASIIRGEIEKLGFKIHSPFKNSDESQFVNFSAQLDNKSLVQYFYDLGFHFSIRGPGVRVTPHAMNTDEEVEKFIHVLKKLK